MSRATPCSKDVALLIHLDELGTAYAAEHGRRVAFSTDFIHLRCIRTVQKPDAIHGIDADPRDLLHTPAVGERLWPERIDTELRGAALVYHLASDDLSPADNTDRPEQC
jgi:hypothetical protein